LLITGPEHQTQASSVNSEIVAPELSARLVYSPRLSSSGNRASDGDPTRFVQGKDFRLHRFGG
jgi:hypothetical protein